MWTTEQPAVEWGKEKGRSGRIDPSISVSAAG